MHSAHAREFTPGPSPGSETRFMLTQVQELNILKFMDGRKTRNADLFKKIAKINRGQPDVALC